MVSQSHNDQYYGVTETQWPILWCHRNTMDNIMVSQSHNGQYYGITESQCSILWCHRVTMDHIMEHIMCHIIWDAAGVLMVF